VSSSGFGEKSIVGWHFLMPEDAKRLAGIQAEALRCEQSQYLVESNCPTILTGFSYSIRDHYNDKYNHAKYLAVEIMSSGHQVGWLQARMGLPIKPNGDQPEYVNHVTSIDVQQQYRMEKKLMKPLIPGNIRAVIDSSTNGKYADVDDKGRYLVRLPWDLDPSHGPGRASARLRMIQPYGGSKEGAFFPLRKGTEVILTCTNGDPDRLIISGATPNPHNPSMVNSKNPWDSVIATPAPNKMVLHDKQDEEYLHLESSQKDSKIRLGALDPPGGASGFSAGVLVQTEGNSYEIVGDAQKGQGALDSSAKKGMYVDGDYQTVVEGDWNGEIKGEVSDKITGDAQKHWYGNYHEFKHGNTLETYIGTKESFSVAQSVEACAGAKEEFFLGGKLGVMVGNNMDISLATDESLFVGDKLDLALAAKQSVNVGGEIALTVAENMDVTLGQNLEFGLGQTIRAAFAQCIELLWNDYFNIVMGALHAEIELCAMKIAVNPLICFELSTICVSAKALEINYTLAELKNKPIDLRPSQINMDL
jgi:type VI secretion system secreted protein VgrG